MDLEITERVLLQDCPEFRKHLTRLKDLGVSLSLDDFGTGFSSLSYLVRFPFDCIKIDRSFITGILHVSTSATVVTAIISLARSLEIEVVAEGRVLGRESLGAGQVTLTGKKRPSGHALTSSPVTAVAS